MSRDVRLRDSTIEDLQEELDETKSQLEFLKQNHVKTIYHLFSLLQSVHHYQFLLSNTVLHVYYVLKRLQFTFYIPDLLLPVLCVTHFLMF